MDITTTATNLMGKAHLAAGQAGLLAGAIVSGFRVGYAGALDAALQAQEQAAEDTARAEALQGIVDEIPGEILDMVRGIGLSLGDILVTVDVEVEE